MDDSPQECGHGAEVQSARRPVRLLVAYEMGEREASWEVAAFRSVKDAVAAAKAMVDSFLLRHHRGSLRGKQLYADYVNRGPEIYVEAAMEEPVFHGWEYARKRVCQICGGW